MVTKELLDDLLPKMEYLIKASLAQKLNVHTSLGGKYGELWVASQLIDYEPRLAHERRDVTVKNSKSSDIVLKRNSVRLEVKHGMCHNKDTFSKRAGNIPLWGWGFSQGKQFLRDKFDYCVLMAAEEGGAEPKHVFVLTCDEMKKKMSQRKSSFGRQSYFLEYSKDPDYYNVRDWTQGMNEAEKLLRDLPLHKNRWSQLVSQGLIE